MILALVLQLAQEGQAGIGEGAGTVAVATERDLDARRVRLSGQLATCVGAVKTRLPPGLSALARRGMTASCVAFGQQEHEPPGDDAVELQIEERGSPRFRSDYLHGRSGNRFENAATIRGDAFDGPDPQPASTSAAVIGSPTPHATSSTRAPAGSESARRPDLGPADARVAARGKRLACSSYPFEGSGWKKGRSSKFEGRRGSIKFQGARTKGSGLRAQGSGQIGDARRARTGDDDDQARQHGCGRDCSWRR